MGCERDPRAEGRFAFRKDGRIIVTTPREALEPLIGAGGITRLVISDDRVGHGAEPVAEGRKSHAATSVAA
jgi:hypothetical protein